MILWFSTAALFLVSKGAGWLTRILTSCSSCYFFPLFFFFNLKYGYFLTERPPNTIQHKLDILQSHPVVSSMQFLLPTKYPRALCLQPLLGAPRRVLSGASIPRTLWAKDFCFLHFPHGLAIFFKCRKAAEGINHHEPFSLLLNSVFTSAG